MAQVLSARSAIYSSSRRIQNLRVGQDPIPDNPVQAVLRDQVNRAAEELLQVILQGEIRHAEIISGNAHVQQVNIAVGSRVPARDRSEDRQLRNAVFLAQLSEPQSHRMDLVQGQWEPLSSSCSLRHAYQSRARLLATKLPIDPALAFAHPHGAGDVTFDQGDLACVREPPADVLRGGCDLDGAVLAPPVPFSLVSCRTGTFLQSRASSSSRSFLVLSLTVST